MATVMFVVALVAIIVLIPVANELMPFISSTMGNSVTFLISAMIVVIIVAAIWVWVNQSSGNGGAGQFGQQDYDAYA